MPSGKCALPLLYERRVLLSKLSVNGGPRLNRCVLLAASCCLVFAGCSPSEHHTELQLANGIGCKYQTIGTFISKSRNLSCTDENGKLILSFESK